ncbi:MAG: chemotaxis protein CheW [Candidatus Bruticola sp.]
MDNINDILIKRAERLAKPIVKTNSSDNSLSLLRFKLGTEFYAIESKYVSEVVSTSNLTPIPGVPDFITGLLSIQGQIWSVIDLRDFFSIPKQGLSDHPRAILVETPSLRFGIMADSQLEIINTDKLCPPPDITERIPRNFIKGTIDYAAVVLDLELLSADSHLVIKDD